MTFTDYTFVQMDVPSRRALYCARGGDALGFDFQLDTSGTLCLASVEPCWSEYFGSNVVAGCKVTIVGASSRLREISQASSIISCGDAQNESPESQLALLLNDPLGVFIVVADTQSAFSSAEVLLEGDSLCAGGSFAAAAASYSALLSDDINGLNRVLRTNRSAAYSLSGAHESAMEDAEWLVRHYPEWPMGYVQRYEAQSKSEGLEVATLGLIAGVCKIPKCVSLLSRVGFVFTKSASFLWLQDGKTSSGQKYLLLAPSSIRGARPAAPPQRLLADAPKNGRIVARDGVHLPVPIELTESSLSESKSIQPSLDLPTVLLVSFESLPRRGSASALQRSFFAPSDVLRATSSVPELNGLYYSQGMRSECPWFENEMGAVLSFEAPYGWVLGRFRLGTSVPELAFVLAPGAHPLRSPPEAWRSCTGSGEGGAQEDPVTVQFSISGKLPSLSSLIKSAPIKPTKQDEEKTEDMTPLEQRGFEEFLAQGQSRPTNVLLALKSHGARLTSGGWLDEARSVYDIVVDQAATLCFVTERHASNQHLHAAFSRLYKDARMGRAKIAMQLGLPAEALRDAAFLLEAYPEDRTVQVIHELAMESKRAAELTTYGSSAAPLLSQQLSPSPEPEAPAEPAPPPPTTPLAPTRDAEKIDPAPPATLLKRIAKLCSC